MARDITKKYTNGELTIVWQPSKCIHSGVCVKKLPKVYHPKERPWITIENASTEELIPQIDACPSAALTYYMNNEENKNTENNATTSVEVVANGPLLVKGQLQVNEPDGTVEHKDQVTAFCRCGQSENKPYCDGTHKKINFQG